METNTQLSLDDVKLVPANWSNIVSRKDTFTRTNINGLDLEVPIIASNMDAVFSPQLSWEIIQAGGQAIVHRFCDIQTNINLFLEGGKNCSKDPWVSVGVGDYELERAKSLYMKGASTILLDVANAASQHVLEQYNSIREITGHTVKVLVASFDNKEQINEFCKRAYILPDAILCGIGPGSACKTSLVAGVGTPSFSCIQSCIQNDYGIKVIMNGGIKTSGDLSKAIAAGASAVIIGKGFAACVESGAPRFGVENKKIYRGSAALSSYEAQGKIADWRCPEGEEFVIPVSGTVKEFMQQMTAGLRSSMTYLGANNIQEFQKNARFIQVTQLGLKESGPHGRTL